MGGAFQIKLTYLPECILEQGDFGATLVQPTPFIRITIVAKLTQKRKYLENMGNPDVLQGPSSSVPAPWKPVKERGRNTQHHPGSSASLSQTVGREEDTGTRLRQGGVC